LTIRICVSIFPETVREAIDFVERAENHKADFVEVRLDCFKDWDKLSDIADCSKVPMIATNRSIKHQGKFLGSETERRQTLTNAVEGGFKYVDVELSISELENTANRLRELGAKLIVSFHDFNKTLSLAKMSRTLEQEIARGADVCKIVTTARLIEDNLTVLNLVSKACKRAKIVCFAMGELGKPSRLLSPLFGAYFTIASLERSRETAPGQLTVQEMRSIYENLGLV